MTSDVRPFVYGLVDPAEPGHIRYVGMAFNPGRPLAHSKEARTGRRGTHKLNWIRSMHREGREPSYLVLEELSPGVSKKLLGFVESCYIRSLGEIGHRLTNSTAGGEGLIDPSADVRKRCGDANRGKEFSQERRDKIGEAHRGKKHSAEWTEAIRASHVRLNKDRPEVNAKRSASHMRYWSDPDVRARWSERMKAAYSPEQRLERALKQVEVARAELQLAQEAQARAEGQNNG